MARESAAGESASTARHEAGRRVSLIPRYLDPGMVEETEQIGQNRMTAEEFRTRCAADLEEIWNYFNDVVDDLNRTVESLEHELVTKNDRIAIKEEQIIAKDRQIGQLVEERDEFRDAFARASIQILEQEPRRRFARGTPGLESERKSTKLPDPPILTDGREPRFEDWLSRVKNKLKANADHYPSQSIKIAYVEGRTGGKAARHLAPRMKEGSAEEYATVEDVYKHLEMIFLDPNKRVNARREFRALRMEAGDEYHDFLAEFLYLAGEGGIGKTELKEELYEKLTFKLKEMMVFHRHTNCTFDEFSTFCSHAVNGLKSIQESKSQAERARSQIEPRSQVHFQSPRTPAGGNRTSPNIGGSVGKTKTELYKAELPKEDTQKLREQSENAKP